MTETEKNALKVRVAKLRGWKIEYQIAMGERVYDPNGVFIAYGNDISKYCPDYPNDLNACAEFEKTLTPGQHYTFRCKLWELTDQSQDRSWNGVNGEEHNRRYCSATATQRCQAFVKVMEGKQ